MYNENIVGDYIWGLIRESDLHFSCKSWKNYSFQNIFVPFFLYYFR